MTKRSDVTAHDYDYCRANAKSIGKARTRRHLGEKGQYARTTEFDQEEYGVLGECAFADRHALSIEPILAARGGATDFVIGRSTIDVKTAVFDPMRPHRSLNLLVRVNRPKADAYVHQVIHIDHKSVTPLGWATRADVEAAEDYLTPSYQIRNKRIMADKLRPYETMCGALGRPDLTDTKGHLPVLLLDVRSEKDGRQLTVHHWVEKGMAAVEVDGIMEDVVYRAHRPDKPIWFACSQGDTAFASIHDAVRSVANTLRGKIDEEAQPAPVNTQAHFHNRLRQQPSTR